MWCYCLHMFHLPQKMTWIPHGSKSHPPTPTLQSPIPLFYISNPEITAFIPFPPLCGTASFFYLQRGTSLNLCLLSLLLPLPLPLPIHIVLQLMSGIRVATLWNGNTSYSQTQHGSLHLHCTQVPHSHSDRHHHPGLHFLQLWHPLNKDRPVSAVPSQQSIQCWCLCYLACTLLYGNRIISLIMRCWANAWCPVRTGTLSFCVIRSTQFLRNTPVNGTLP